MKRLLTLLILLSLQIPVYAIGALEEINPTDTILIVSPHPDDAALATGGLIQKALKKKAKVKIVYITSGKHNLASLILYKGFILERRKGALDLGKLRREESRQATQILGLKKDDLIFLDYPDSGILKIFKKHWENNNPFKDSLTKATQLGKKEGISAYSLYKGDNILKDLKKVILKVKPDKVFVPSSYDKNRDHIGSYLFLRLALLDLKNKINTPRLYLYIVHRGGLSILERYRPKDYLVTDKENDSKGWKILKLSEDEISKKRDAILKFKSQMYCKKFLLSFVNDELFEEKPPFSMLNKESSVTKIIKRNDKTTAKIKLLLENNILVVKTIFLKKIDIKRTRGKIYIFGYKEKEDFGKMPKTYLSFRQRKWNLYAQNKKIPKLKEISFKVEKDNCIFTVPLDTLDNPDFIFFSIDISSVTNNLYLPWELIKIENKPR